jgi:tripartite-type tricarboxylate transporter receptor subunit TctC
VIRQAHHSRRIRFAPGVFFAVIAVPVGAQDYPAKPLRILVPNAPGGSTDILARIVGERLADKWGQQVLIDNRGGAGGNIAAELTAKSPADGYSIMMGTVGTHAINYSLYSKLPYHPQRDFTPIALVGENPNILVINPYVPAKSIKELIALGKARPGALNYGSSGAGTSVHLSAELFSTMAGIKMVHVPYKGATEALTALLAGQLDLMFASLSSAIPLVKAGRLRAFAVTGEKRSSSIPEMPTISEAALPGYSASAWFGLVGPAGLPPAAVTALSNAALAALQTQEVKDRFFASGVDVRPMPADEFARLIDSEIKKWAQVVKASGARVD